jgi:hypothetical protein
MSRRCHLLLTRVALRHQSQALGTTADPVAGSIQQPVHEHCRTDGIVAAKYRRVGQHQGSGLDFSCALPDGDGNIRTVIRENAAASAGDVYTNDPITAARIAGHYGHHVAFDAAGYRDPVPASGQKSGHHAAIGGITLKDAANSTVIEEEGVLTDTISSGVVTVPRTGNHAAVVRALPGAQYQLSNPADL